MNSGDAPIQIGTPPAEFVIDSALVAGLVADQHLDLAHLPLWVVDAGWDNALFRLGDHLAVRLPRRAAAAPLVLHEQRWLPRLADQLTLPVPAPIRIGTPARGYPWHWSVVPWLPALLPELSIGAILHRVIAPPIWQRSGCSSPSRARADALSEYSDLSEATLHRARGWAILFGVLLLDTGLIDTPRHALIGERTLQRVAEPISKGRP